MHFQPQNVSEYPRDSQACSEVLCARSRTSQVFERMRKNSTAAWQHSMGGQIDRLCIELLGFSKLEANLGKLLRGTSSQFWTSTCDACASASLELPLSWTCSFGWKVHDTWHMVQPFVLQQGCAPTSLVNARQRCMQRAIGASRRHSTALSSSPKFSSALTDWCCEAVASCILNSAGWLGPRSGGPHTRVASLHARTAWPSVPAHAKRSRLFHTQINQGLALECHSCILFIQVATGGRAFSVLTQTLL